MKTIIRLTILLLALISLPLYADCKGKELKIHNQTDKDVTFSFGIDQTGGGWFLQENLQSHQSRGIGKTTGPTGGCDSKGEALYTVNFYDASSKDKICTYQGSLTSGCDGCKEHYKSLDCDTDKMTVNAESTGHTNTDIYLKMVDPAIM